MRPIVCAASVAMRRYRALYARREAGKAMDVTEARDLPRRVCHDLGASPISVREQRISAHVEAGLDTGDQGLSPRSRPGWTFQLGHRADEAATSLPTWRLASRENTLMVVRSSSPQALQAPEQHIRSMGLD